MIYLVVGAWVVAGIFVCLVTARIAEDRGQDSSAWGIAGLLLGPVALLAIGLYPSKSEASLSSLRRAVDTYRRLAAMKPEVYERDLSNALHGLAMKAWRSRGYADEALANVAEAVEIRRKLVMLAPGSNDADLARSLWAHAWIAVESGETLSLSRAMASAEEAVARYESLAEQSPSIRGKELPAAQDTLRRLRAAARSLGSSET